MASATTNADSTTIIEKAASVSIIPTVIDLSVIQSTSSSNPKSGAELLSSSTSTSIKTIPTSTSQGGQGPTSTKTNEPVPDIIVKEALRSSSTPGSGNATPSNNNISPTSTSALPGTTTQVVLSPSTSLSIVPSTSSVSITTAALSSPVPSQSTSASLTSSTSTSVASSVSLNPLLAAPSKNQDQKPPAPAVTPPRDSQPQSPAVTLPSTPPKLPGSSISSSTSTASPPPSGVISIPATPPGGSVQNQGNQIFSAAEKAPAARPAQTAPPQKGAILVGGQESPVASLPSGIPTDIPNPLSTITTNPTLSGLVVAGSPTSIISLTTGDPISAAILSTSTADAVSFVSQVSTGPAGSQVTTIGEGRVPTGGQGAHDQPSPTGLSPGASGNRDSAGVSEGSALHPSKASIGGAAVGGIAILVIIAMLIWFWRKKKAARASGPLISPPASYSSMEQRGSSRMVPEKAIPQKNTRVPGLSGVLGYFGKTLGTSKPASEKAVSGVNMNRGNSQFLEYAAIGESTNTNTPGQRRISSDLNGQEDLGIGLGLSFRKGEGSDPFADYNASPTNNRRHSNMRISNPFVDSDMILPPPASARTNSVRRSRGRSLVGIRAFQASILPSRPHSVHRESLQSNSSFAERRNKFRSDPFDLEIESRLTPTAENIADMPQRYTRRTSSCYSMQLAPARAESFTSKYISGNSLGEWTEPGPDIGPSVTGRQDSPTLNMDELPGFGQHARGHSASGMVGRAL